MLGFLKGLFGPKGRSFSRVLKVLLVEDNELDRKVVTEILMKQGWHIIHAENGARAIESAKNNKPDIIIMDCLMPEMGGIEACREIKDSKETEDIPVIFLTSDETPSNIIDCFDVEAENYLAKPVNSKVLVENIIHIISEKNRN